MTEKSMLQWYGHVKRMEESKYAREYLDWIPQGRRPIRRLRKRWIRGTEDAIQRRGKTLEEVNENGDYRSRDL